MSDVTVKSVQHYIVSESVQTYSSTITQITSTIISASETWILLFWCHQCVTRLQPTM